MARAKITTSFFNANTGVLLDATANYNVRLRGTATSATVYSAQTGSGTNANPGSLSSVGRVDGWVDEGSYDVVVSGTGFTTYTMPFEAVSGAATVNQRVVNVKDFGAVGDGVTDDAAAINAAVAALSTTGGVVVFPKGTYLVSSTLVLDQKTSIVLTGAGAARAGTSLLFTVTGSTTALSMRSAQSCIVERMELKHTSTSWAGKLIDFTKVSGQADTSMNSLRTLRLNMPVDAGSGATGLNLTDSYGTHFIDGWVTGGAVGIDGVPDNTHFINATTIENVNFGSQNIAPLRNLTADAANGITLLKCTFEPLLSGNAGAYIQTNTLPGGVLVFDGCWFGDANTTGSWILVNGGIVTLTGSYLTKGASAIKSNADVTLLVTGNQFRSMTNVVDSTTGNVSLHAFGNTLTSVSTPFPGPYADNSIVEVTSGNGEFRVYGQSITADYGSTTHVRIANPNGTAPQIFFGPGENTGLQLDPSGALKASYGMCAKIKAGAISDADFLAAPPDGTWGVNTTASTIMVRIGGTWKSTAALT